MQIEPSFRVFLGAIAHGGNQCLRNENKQAIFIQNCLNQALRRACEGPPRYLRHPRLGRSSWYSLHTPEEKQWEGRHLQCLWGREDPQVQF